MRYSAALRPSPAALATIDAVMSRENALVPRLINWAEESTSNARLVLKWPGATSSVRAFTVEPATSVRQPRTIFFTRRDEDEPCYVDSFDPMYAALMWPLVCPDGAPPRLKGLVDSAGTVLRPAGALLDKEAKNIRQETLALMLQPERTSRGANLVMPTPAGIHAGISELRHPTSEAAPVTGKLTVQRVVRTCRAPGRMQEPAGPLSVGESAPAATAPTEAVGAVRPEPASELASDPPSSDPAPEPEGASADAPTDGEAQAVELSEAQAMEVIAAVEAVRAGGATAETELHGWHIGFSAAARGAPRGDLVVVDPRDGSKLHSVVSLKRRLSLLPPAEAPPSPEPEPEPEEEEELGLGGRPRRRAAQNVSYAEAALTAPKPSDIVVARLAAAEREEQAGSAGGGGECRGVVWVAEAIAGEYNDFHAKAPPPKRAKTGGGGKRGAAEEELVPVVATRAALSSLLRQGRVRRWLVSPASGCLAPPSTIEGALGRLLLQTLQADEPAGGAEGSDAPPWRLALRPGGGGEASEGGGSAAPKVRSLGGVAMEPLVSVDALKGMLPVAPFDASAFAAPPGWREGGGADGGPWLGQLSGGEWQIRSRAATRAISHVVGQLRGLGLVSVVPPHASGRSTELVVINNHYATGEPREEEREKRSRQRKEPEEEEEDLADIEKERLRNIARNQELLRQLGLA
ncbi:hypothetical protein EMIHUDRAFT_450551 [Emiliania huxleyi CCMP1516]|uniref:Uncharacterized protein n=2 Tax=Emiliania huxleyi TaxID=2903 RepID=A0A0D3JM86_EMIH1|nr:hypothetical protein EMIHUDRAFT_450551 [Emiliania huxleyi CCMP1516]EOD24621.1 hypothetical protein EMIHUDRAFT_450551 [Emiliania huxleyi CCMP1516]|eukprot:XP_005777050.1 hypothetical protein EMIHUDRAFT_450551 [Emiliania huxleyi CCMP1516]